MLYVVPNPRKQFYNLSLALRSHNQFQASHRPPLTSVPKSAKKCSKFNKKGTKQGAKNKTKITSSDQKHNKKCQEVRQRVFHPKVLKSAKKCSRCNKKSPKQGQKMKPKWHPVAKNTTKNAKKCVDALFHLFMTIFFLTKYFPYSYDQDLGVGTKMHFFMQNKKLKKIN